MKSHIQVALSLLGVLLFATVSEAQFTFDSAKAHSHVQSTTFEGTWVRRMSVEAQNQNAYPLGNAVAVRNSTTEFWFFYEFRPEDGPMIAMFESRASGALVRVTYDPVCFYVLGFEGLDPTPVPTPPPTPTPTPLPTPTPWPSATPTPTPWPTATPTPWPTATPTPTPRPTPKPRSKPGTRLKPTPKPKLGRISTLAGRPVTESEAGRCTVDFDQEKTGETLRQLGEEGFGLIQLHKWGLLPEASKIDRQVRVGDLAKSERTAPVRCPVDSAGPRGP